MTRTAWVVGASGLMGRHVVTALTASGRRVLTRAVPWGDPGPAIDALAEGIDALADEAGATGEWEIFWCAGAGVVSTAAEALDNEVRVFDRFLTDLAVRLPGPGSTGGSSPGSARGSLFLASSAGGVYAGSVGLPYTEQTEPRTTSAYGESKLAIERRATRYAEETGTPVFVARVSNLYGPGQNLTKPQGLVSALCRAVLLGTPVPITVSLETRRDYLFADDCAAMIVAGCDRLRADGPWEGPVVKILDSGRTSSIAELIEATEQVVGTAPPVEISGAPQAPGQALDLTFESLVWPELQRLVVTPIAEGIRLTMRDTAAQLGLPSPVAPD